MISRREMILSSLAGALAAKADAGSLKIGHRQASMARKSGTDVFEIAKQIPGLSGVELQVHWQGQSLWDRDVMLGYKKKAEKTGLLIPSIAGVWEKGVNILQPGPAEESIRKSIRAAEGLGAKVILVASFRDNCPKMDDEASYGPVVKLLQKVSPQAADAGVTLGLEDSLSPADDKKLVDLVNRPSVRIYYDAHNVETYGHTGQAVPGYEILGKSRICQIHLKNGDRLLEEPGKVDWVAALKALRQIRYDGWYVFETSHSSPEQCIEATKKNIAFIKRNLGV